MPEVTALRPRAAVDLPSGGNTSGGKDDNPPGRELETLVHGWLKERFQEGERINKHDPAFSRSTDLISDVMGDQLATLMKDSNSRKVLLNQTRKAINTHASMLTDVEPLWEYRTENIDFKRIAKVYNDLLTVWWIQTFCDLELADGIRFAATIGSSDVLCEYDKNFNGGDMRLHARDWRDTLPIRPERSASVQDWEGIVYSEAHSAAKMRAAFPGLPGSIVAGSGNVGVGVFTRYRKLTRPEAQITSTLSGLGEKSPEQSKYDASTAQSQVMLYRTFVRDRSINKSAGPVLMGPPGANWSYFVNPGKPLYPRGRLMICTDTGMCYDGPNPYWHGLWPSTRLSLQRWPWLMVGMPLAFDLRQLATMLNITVNDILLTFQQWVYRGSVWGKNVPESLFQRFNPTQPNWKMKVNTVAGTGMQMQDGPNLPPWTFQFLTFLFQKWDELSGTANLQQLLTLRQSPSAETLDKYLQAMTPEIRMEARQIELFLRDLSQFFIYNVSQFYSQARRELLLGESGKTLQDLDLDPGTMIPALAPRNPDGSENPAYTPELDAALPREKRAKFFLKQFGFYVAPNSILAMHAQEKKMLYLQLSRQGYVDFWTMGEMFGIPNLGEPPMMPLPKNLTAAEIQALPQAPDPQTGQMVPQVPMELRRPVTVTERLQAQQQLGIGMTASPAGRKASGQEPPQLKQKSDGSTTVTES